ncbi:unnamed protein product [Ceutorhynchus assimilis]|uniref:VWFC domain-containing protein n=1 Tax=Ceutorhynchus assimilis TaxID=467358 RepID=A0A9P0DBD4_9CUCU|nr:unnamed protein product [Ceutorhynchus assimilis]
MNGNGIFRLILFVAVNFLFDSPTANAGVVKRSIRMVREVYPPDIEPENEGIQPPAPQVCIVGDVVYAADETVLAEQLCLKCRCQPPGVQCETVQCAKKPGCKAIHRPNQCCPDYQCECEHDGKIYGNGEKLETNPGGECKVCYCRGGEVQCAEVSCYVRNDCEGKRVPGTCCPKYDNCPPIDILDRSSLITEQPANTFKPTHFQIWQEINSTEVPSLPTENSIPEDSNKVPDTSDSATASPFFEEISKPVDTSHPRITIQEIIPEVKEIPVTSPPKIYISEPQGTLVIEESLPARENTSNDLNMDSEPESSEVSEVFQHPPPVLRIGDKLLFLKKGNLIPEKDTTTADSIITIIGAEGLQRGGVEESLEVHEVRIDPQVDISNGKAISNTQDQSEIHNTSGDLESIYESFNLTKIVQEPNTNTDTNDLELKSAESTHILSLVKRKNTKALTTTSTIPTTTRPKEISTTSASIVEEPQSQTTVLPETGGTTVINETTGINTSTTILPVIEARTESQPKSTELVAEQNPAYPPIPDIMPAVGDVSQKFEIELENDNSTTMEIKILPEVFDFLSNKSRNNETHSEWLKSPTGGKINGTVGNFNAVILPDEKFKERSSFDEENATRILSMTSDPESENFKTVITVDNIGDSSIKTSSEGDAEKAKTDNFGVLKKKETLENKEKEPQKLGAASEKVLLQRKQSSTGEIQQETERIIENKTEKQLLEEGAQLIAEVKLSGNEFENAESSSESPSIITISSIVSEAIGKDKLKNNEDENKLNLAVIMKASELEVAKLDHLSKPTTAIIPRYVESIETDSGEQTTPKANHSSMISSESASVEIAQLEDKTKHSETRDMTSRKENSFELGSVEIIDNSSDAIPKDVEMIGVQEINLFSTTEVYKKNEMEQDVEVIHLLTTPKPTNPARVETSTYELLPTPEQAKSKTLIKRDTTGDDNVFKDLEKELEAESSGNSFKDPKKEESEADEIFKELLNENIGNTKIKPKTKEQEKIDNISDALAGFALKGQIPDPNVLRLIGELFGGQQRE